MTLANEGNLHTCYDGLPCWEHDLFSAQHWLVTFPGEWARTAPFEGAYSHVICKCRCRSFLRISSFQEVAAVQIFGNSSQINCKIDNLDRQRDRNAWYMVIYHLLSSHGDNFLTSAPLLPWEWISTKVSWDCLRLILLKQQENDTLEYTKH